MGRKSSEISSQLLLKVIGQPLQKLQKYSIQETIYITTSGVSKLFTGVIANSISLFVDLTRKFVFYFDSNGTKMPKQIKVLINRIVDQARNLNIQLTVDNNEGFTHQYSDGQCGMYALYFVIELLQENKTYSYFKNTRIKDSTMKKYRKKYYNEANIKLGPQFM